VEKLLVVVFLAFILWNLFAALFHMLTKPQADGRMVRSLSWRIGLSIALLAILGAGHYLGWWQFHGLRQ
jgi:Zn-dependent protease